MEKDKNKQTSDEGCRSVELKDFFLSEIGKEEYWEDEDKTFAPITSGLGMKTPSSKDSGDSPQYYTDKLIKKIVEDDDISFRSHQHQNSHKKEDTNQPEIRKHVGRLDLSQPLETSKEVAKEVNEDIILPPPGRIGVLPRFLSGILDYLFISTLWVLGALATVHLTQAVPSSMALPYLIQSGWGTGLLGTYLGLWFLYFIFCFSLLDMTFGMWIWGIRVGYMTKKSETMIFRRMKRALLSVLFFAPVLPVVILAIMTSSKKNLLDFLSGTVLYQAINEEEAA